ncbi:Uncharacterised protein [Mycobacteroides abscessus subsp. abscessus]|nr:Uncharacterised protein [Mycobacteroides abscessus subsp. abscessus]
MNDAALRKPPMLLSDTFNVGGGASPRTPEMRTRSCPSAVSSSESTRRVASGLA